jgi:hypothetical protein
MNLFLRKYQSPAFSPAQKGPSRFRREALFATQAGMAEREKEIGQESF